MASLSQFWRPPPPPLPLQIQSNAIAALEAIAPEAAELIKAAGTVTGDRVNGLVDGISGQWYCKFDTFNVRGGRTRGGAFV